MAALHILIADDQIPPSRIPEEEFREQFLAKHGDNPQNRRFLEQCVFMGEIVRALRDSGYQITVARTYREATKHISDSEFDLAIIDLGWYMDFSLADADRPAAGWSLCQLLDEKAEERGTRIPQIIFSSRFPSEPELSREAARRQKLPLFKEATPVTRNSLMAAVGFVEATLATQRLPGSLGPSRFDRDLEGIALSFFREPLRDYRRWAGLTLIFVALSIACLLAGVVLALFTSKLKAATLSSISSVVSSMISVLLYKQLDAARKAVEFARGEVLKRLQQESKSN